MIAGVVIAGSAGGGGSAAPARSAPALPRQVLHGPAVTIGDLRGRPAVVNFWASWCTPCRKEAPELERFARSLGGRARLVGVDWNDDAGEARAFIRRSGWTYPVLRDGDDTAGARFGVEGLPTTFVLDARGRITATLRGPQTAAKLRAAVADAA